MVWEYQVPTIVMLTRCVENARVSLSLTILYYSYIVFNSMLPVNVFLSTHISNSYTTKGKH